jgi:CRISPR system Cascade subunit CasB
MEATAKPAGTEPRTGHETAFVEALEKLSTGERARLKRHAGMSLSESSDVFGPFFRILPHEIRDPARQEAYFLVATLFPLADASNARNFGMTMRQMRTDGNKAGLDRRMEALLDADREQLPFRLRQLVRLAHANRVGVNWAQLLRDVIAWEQQGRRVQKHWAMSYFASHGRDSEAPETASSDDAQVLADDVAGGDDL